MVTACRPLFSLLIEVKDKSLAKKKPHGAGFELMDRTLPPKSCSDNHPLSLLEGFICFSV